MRLSGSSGRLCRPFATTNGNDAAAGAPQVVIPLPGMLLNRDIFQAHRLRDSLGTGSEAQVVIDAELGESAVFHAASVGEAADLVARGLSERHQGARAVLVGHSYGGYAALEMAKRWPEQVSGLVLVATQCRGDSSSASKRRRELVALAKREGPDRFMERMLPVMLAASSSSAAAAAKRIFNPVGIDTVARQMHSCAARQDQRGTLQGLHPDIPVLVLAGSHDRLIPPCCAREMRELLDLRAGSRDVAPWSVKILPRSGHLVPLEQPDRFYDTLLSWAQDIQKHRQSLERSH